MKEMNPIVREMIEWTACIVIAVALALLVRHFVGTPTVVQQPSMYPTLEEGQRLLLNRWARTTNSEFKRGDIITFEAPNEDYVSAYEADLENPIANYDEEPQGIFKRFSYYVLEIGKKSYIKRVIATEGEHVEIKEGSVYINGEKLDEPYLQDDVVTGFLNGLYTDLTVPEGCVYVLGDNRSHSTDSRRFGCIPVDKIESKVFIRFGHLAYLEK